MKWILVPVIYCQRWMRFQRCNDGIGKLTAEYLYYVLVYEALFSIS